MTKDFLFEIGVEEMPAHVVSKSVKQLADRIGTVSYTHLRAHET